MSNTVNNGGPAFPQDAAPAWTDLKQAHPGMTLRDYFSAHAPTPPETWKAKKDEAENIIAWRWAYADAMLAAREAK